MLAFVISLDDVVITEFVKSGGQDTLPTYMLGQLRRGVTPEINAISTVFLALSIGIVTVFLLHQQETDLRPHRRRSQQWENKHELETDRDGRRAVAAGCHGRRPRRRRAQHLQLGQLHQPRADQEIRGRATRSRSPSPTIDSNDTALAKIAPGRRRLRHRRAVGQRRSDLDQRRPAAGDRSRPDGEFQERRSEMGRRAVRSGPQIHRAVAVGHDRHVGRTSRSIPATRTPRRSSSIRQPSWSARSMSCPRWATSCTSPSPMSAANPAPATRRC